MREIKFRAWDLNEDEYIPWDRLIRTRYNQDYFRMNNQGDIILGMMTDKHIQLEQFTGLLDKNGREVYEGDILAINYPEHVAWNAGESIKAISFVAEDADFNTPSREDWHLAITEVIGNIHENPELLK